MCYREAVIPINIGVLTSCLKRGIERPLLRTLTITMNKNIVVDTRFTRHIGKIFTHAKIIYHEANDINPPYRRPFAPPHFRSVNLFRTQWGFDACDHQRERESSDWYTLLKNPRLSLRYEEIKPRPPRKVR